MLHNMNIYVPVFKVWYESGGRQNTLSFIKVFSDQQMHNLLTT
jgi:hypothetical protein